MDWQYELSLIGRIALATLLGALMGFDRERHGHAAGIRTYSAVAIGACAFTILSTASDANDPNRIAAQIVSGIGFLGAGAILRSGSNIYGLTTAATIWVSAAVGMAVGFQAYILAIVVTSANLLVLWVNHLPFWSKLRKFDPMHHEEE